MKYTLVTTSVLALLLAGPAFAETGTKPKADADIIVKQPPAQVTVQQQPPNVTVTQGKPQVDVQSTKPDVRVQQGKPDVTVVPADKNAVGSGSTTPGDATATDRQANIGPRGTAPMAADAENIIGKDVYGASGNDVGDVENLLIGSDGRVRAAVIAFGGFLGMGETHVAVPWDQLKIGGDRVTVNMTEEQIKAAPRWDKDNPGTFADARPYR